MDENISKDKLLSMLLSDDLEIRKLGRNYLDTNFTINFWVERIWLYGGKLIDTEKVINFCYYDNAFYTEEYANYILTNIIIHPELYTVTAVKDFINEIYKRNGR